MACQCIGWSAKRALKSDAAECWGEDVRFHNGKCHDKKYELFTMHNPYQKS
jgi:hypothetical protein